MKTNLSEKLIAMKKTDSIAFIFSGLYVGGAEKFGISLANKFVADGIPTHLILFENFKSPMFDQVDKRIEIIYIKRRHKLDIILNRQFEVEIGKRSINKVIFFCLSPLFLTRFMSFSRNKSVDYFISLHSTIPSSFKTRVKNLIFFTLTRKSDTALFICHNQREYHKKYYFFNPRLYDVIYNGVDIDYFKPGSGQIIVNKREALKIGPMEKMILLVATIRPEKGHGFAIEALNILHQKYSGKGNTHLVFTGDGLPEYITKLKQLVTKYNLGSYVHFEGNQKDVRAYYEVADIFTLTSSGETFSIAALEAMCYGLPISLTNIGGAAEMVVEGMNGNLSKTKDSASMAQSWAHLIDAGLDRQAIRVHTEKNYSLKLIFNQYKKVILSQPSVLQQATISTEKS